MRLLPFAGPAVLAAALISATGALAQPPATYEWSGYYLGVAAGAASGRSSATTVVACPVGGYLCAPGIQEDNGVFVGEIGSGSATGTEFTGSAFLGRNWQSGGFVYGLEADLGVLPLSLISGGSAATVNEGLQNEGVPATFTMTATASTNWLATGRVRFGFLPSPNLFLYGTGGLALADLTVSNFYADDFDNDVGTGGSGSSSTSALRAAFTIGVGAEVAMHSGWRLRAEYLHVDFGSLATTAPVDYAPEWYAVNSIASTASLRADIFRVGVARGF